MTTQFNSPEELATDTAVRQYEQYRKNVDAEELQRDREHALTVALAAHSEAAQAVQEKTEAAIGKWSVKLGKAILEFRDALDEVNEIEAQARTTALARHAELYPGVKRSALNLLTGKEHQQPAAAGHTVARILTRIMRENNIAEPQRHWSQI